MNSNQRLGGSTWQGVSAVGRALVRQPVLALCFLAYGGATVASALFLPEIATMLVQVVLAFAALVPLIVLAVNAVRVARGEDVLSFGAAFAAKKDRYWPYIGWGILMGLAASVAVALCFVFAVLSWVAVIVALAVVFAAVIGVTTAGLGYTLNGPGFQVTRRTFFAGVIVGLGALVLQVVGEGTAIAAVLLGEASAVALVVSAVALALVYPLVFVTSAVLAVVADNSGVNEPAPEEVAPEGAAVDEALESFEEPAVPADEPSSDSPS